MPKIVFKPVITARFDFNTCQPPYRNLDIVGSIIIFQPPFRSAPLIESSRPRGVAEKPTLAPTSPHTTSPTRLAALPTFPLTTLTPILPRYRCEYCPSLSP